MPTTKPLSNTEAEALEKQLSAPAQPAPADADAPDRFLVAMSSLTAAMGETLAAETGDESLAVSPQDAAAATTTIADRFRTASEIA